MLRFRLNWSWLMKLMRYVASTISRNGSSRCTDTLMRSLIGVRWSYSSIVIVSPRLV